MSIEAGTIYDSMTYSRNGVSRWTIQGPVSGDQVAGLVVGFATILKSTNNQIGLKFNDTIDLLVNEGKRLITIQLQNENSYRLALTDYYIYTVNRDEIISKTYDILPHTASFGWWIEQSLNTSYALYSFQSYEFIQGFITSMNTFGVDFRNYILGPPFTYELNQKAPVYYMIEGYDIDPIPSQKIPAPVGAFYTGLYEADPYGEDFE